MRGSRLVIRKTGGGVSPPEDALRAAERSKEELLNDRFDRRQWLRIAGASLGFGALYRFAPALGSGGPGSALARALGRKNGERPVPFSFVQLSDTHVGLAGAHNPRGTEAFERAVEVINGLPERPELVLFTGDLTHDSEKPGEHADRMTLFPRDRGGPEGPRSCASFRASTTRAWTAARSSGTRSARRTIPSTTAASTSSRSTTSRWASPTSAPSRSPG